MARTTYTLVYNGTRDFALDLTFERDRFVRHIFRKGETLDVTDTAGPDELNRHPILYALLQAGTFDITVVPGADDIVGVEATLSDDAPVDVAATGGDDPGVANGASRSDHVHALGALVVDTGNIAANAVTTAKILDANVTAGKLADGIVSTAKTANAASGVGVISVIRATLTGAAPGAADDVAIYTANAPYTFRVLDAVAYISAAVAGTLEVRDTAGGAGTLLAGAIDTTAEGVARAAGTTPTATAQVAANGTLTVRRSDRSAAGEILITIVREA